MVSKTCAFVRHGNTPVGIPKRSHPGLLTLVGTSYRCSWMPSDDGDSIFDEFMHGGMSLNIDGILTVIKPIPITERRSLQHLVIGITARTTQSGVRENDTLCSMMKGAKTSGWNCIVVCDDAKYLNKLDCPDDAIDLIVCRRGKTRRKTPVVFTTEDVISDFPQIAKLMLEIATH